MPRRTLVEPAKASIGQNIASIRKQRGLTQQGLALKANISYSHPTKVEAGLRACAPKMTAACARVLRVPVTDLTGQPYISSLKDEGLEELVQPLREAISNPMLPGFEDNVPPRLIGEIVFDLAELNAARLSGEYMTLGVRVPALIDELIEHVHGAPSAQRREEAYSHLAEAYRLGNCFAHKLGFLDLSLIALDRMQSAAIRSSDPYLQVVVTHYRSDYFRYHGAYDVGLRGIRAMELLVEEPAQRGDPKALSALGTMHLKAAVLHSRQRRQSAASDAFARIAEIRAIRRFALSELGGRAHASAGQLSRIEVATRPSRGADAAVSRLRSAVVRNPRRPPTSSALIPSERSLQCGFPPGFP
jgi:XRE family transcriptional regulator, fatty acid utilization regulator